MTSYVILCQPNFNKTFWLYTDALSVAIGMVLTQFDDKNHEYVITYFSRMFKSYENKSRFQKKKWLSAFLAFQSTYHIWLDITLNL